MTRLTLCMIVRDEADLLPGCLASVRGVVDAVVIVDTGSSDATALIAERAGARVIHRPWDDDFAAARNASIAPVQEGWVLVLDADERLAPGAGDVLRAAVEEGGFDCGLLALHDADALDAAPADVLSGARRLCNPTWLGRLLRRTPDLAWESIVHEHVTAWAQRHPRQRRLDAAIVHYGAAPAVRAARGKHARNRRLLERRCRLEPENAQALTYLCQDLAAVGETARALDHARRAWRLVECAHARPGAAPDPIPVATNLAVLLLHSGATGEARSALRRAQDLAGPHPNLQLLLAHAAELDWQRAAGHAPSASVLAEAEALLRACVAQAGAPLASPEIPGATTWAGGTRLGSVLLLQARPHDALAAFDAVLAARPRHVEAHLGRAEALIGLERHAEALAVLEPLLHPDLPDGWILAAAAGLPFEGARGVAAFVTQARRALAGRKPIAPHRARWLDAVAPEGAAQAARI